MNQAPPRGGSGGTSARPEYVKETQHGDIPAPRFGHTTTLVGNNRVVLFGGATGDSGRYTIIADAYMLDAETNIWSRIVADGNVPSARAAHAAACVDHSQMVVYGGATGGGSLSCEDLYLLDIRNLERAQWMSVPIAGTTPGKRYGHSMIFNKPLLIVFGGNNGTQAEQDIWVLDVERSPFNWSEVSVIHARCPLPRVYHSAEVCREGPAAGMMVVFGGRTSDNRSLKDIWGLRQHRDGRWDWVEAPTKRGKPPDPRFQHSCVFLGSKLLVIGGRGSDVNKPLPTSVYDTETCEWRNVASVCRFRHSCWGMGPALFSYGGFDHKSPSAPTADLQVLDMDRAIDASLLPGSEDDENWPGKESNPSSTFGETLDSAANLQMTLQPQNAAPSSAAAAAAAAATTAAAATSLANTSQGAAPKARRDANTNALPARAPAAEAPRQSTPPRVRPGVAAALSASAPYEPSKGDVRVSDQVFVSLEKDFTHLVHKVAIDSLEDEARKMQPSNVMAGVAQSQTGGVASYAIEQLLQPTTWAPDPNNNFVLTPLQVSQLCEQVLEILKTQDMLLKVRAPIKVFGDIHGQYLDLMRLFARYKAPTDSDNGDIDSMDYLFLGDFVDRGSFSLESACLLFALKVKYPTQIHLIRGNHEDPTINSIYGFRDECKRRLREETEEPDSCWNKFNRAFEWLPVAAVIEEKILCLHGGIGGSISVISELEAMERPLHVAQIPQTAPEQRVTDLLWSDPSDSDTVMGVTMNETRDPDGTGRIVKYGPDRVEEFLKMNPPLCMIIRAHECVMDGFERFANGRLITVFSATDYCGHHKNAGALLFVRRDLTVVPKLIYPIERNNNWDPTIVQQRPPTPPRAVPRGRGSRTEQ